MRLKRWFRCGLAACAGMLLAALATCSMPGAETGLRNTFVSPNEIGGFARRTQAASAFPGVTGASAIPGSVPAPDEELWIIQRGPAADAPQLPAHDMPRSGQLLARVPGESTPVPVPLKHTDVKAAITGYIATVDVTQQFQNPFAEKIEAVYVFPLPENAGISEFVMTIGERHIRGIIRDRAEAEKIYQEARRQGYVASLLTQERPNIFTQSVANIEPGKQIDISIRYFHTLAYHDGWYEFVFPMVVGPRYNPAGSTEGVGAVARGAQGISGQNTEVQYLAPSERSGHDISLAVDIDAGVPIEELVCTNHTIDRPVTAGSHTLVRIADRDTIPNKDFVLRYRVAGKTVKSGLLVQHDPQAKDGAGYFALMVYPPEDLRSLPRRSVEMVFVVDTSGSMSGAPLAQAKAAVRCALGRMQPGDTFQIVNFASSASQMSPQPLAANAENVQRALAYVDGLHEGGGTEMLKGINAALDFPHDAERTRVVTFLTDGYIGNEAQILRALHDKLAASRVFSFGVGTSVNRYLLDAMARIGNGAVAYLGLHEDADKVMAAYFERISHPALANLKIDWGGMKVEDVYPQRLPDLFVGRPVVLTGRFTGTADGVVKVTGSVGKESLSFTIPVNTEDKAARHPAIPVIWARMKIGDLYQRAIYEPGEWDAQIKQTALEYGIMSAYTAFVALDSMTKTAGDHGTTVVVPVPMPEGVRYDTTVTQPNGAAPEP